MGVVSGLFRLALVSPPPTRCYRRSRHLPKWGDLVFKFFPGSYVGGKRSTTLFRRDFHLVAQGVDIHPLSHDEEGLFFHGVRLVAIG